MRYLVTGADGFVGSSIIAELLSRGHSIIATSSEHTRASTMRWFGDVEYHELDPSLPNIDLPSSFESVDRIIHLGWSDIPKYLDMVHIEKNLMWSYWFLRRLIHAGVCDVTVLGTCLEYGMKNGEIVEETPPAPHIPYAVAKDALRRFLEQLQGSISFRLKWVRLFYVYGPGQRLNSLVGALDAAIDRGDSSFDMSTGEQIRDYLRIDRAAHAIVRVSEQERVLGAINCGSGNPISVRRFVEEYISNRGGRMVLNVGRRTYPDYEPLAFWASTVKLREAIDEEW
ncbi:MAG: NAD-dependent epimerase/dehydratase family protein [Planctomycetes bacterium]|nr:NAD-dependent epimerase/dehydratase family protein [Planctomycetota bacterium]